MHTYIVTYMHTVDTSTRHTARYIMLSRAAIWSGVRGHARAFAGPFACSTHTYRNAQIRGIQLQFMLLALARADTLRVRDSEAGVRAVEQLALWGRDVVGVQPRSHDERTHCTHEYIA